MNLLQSSKEEWLQLFHDYINPEEIAYQIEANAWFNTWFHYLYLAILILIALRLLISCLFAIKKLFSKNITIIQNASDSHSGHSNDISQNIGQCKKNKGCDW